MGGEGDRMTGGRDGMRRKRMRSAGRSAGGEASASAASSRFGLFMRSAFFDYVLVLVVAVGLSYTVSYGFNSAPELRQDLPVTVGLTGLLLACLYAGAWSRRAVPLAAMGYAALSIAVVVGLSSLSPDPQPMFSDGSVNDVAGNFGVYGLIVVVVPAAVYLLSRRPAGVAVLLLAASLACGAIQFLYRDWVAEQPGAAVALVVYGGIGALFVLQGYRRGVLSSRTARKTSFFVSFAFGVATSCCCVLAAVVLFLGIVSALGIQTVNVKPFEDYYSRPVIEYDGTYRQQEIIDPDVGTSALSDDEEDTIDDAEGYEGEDDSESGGGFVLVSTIVSALNMDEWSNVFDAVSFQVPPGVVALLVALPALALAIAVLVRRSLRERRLRKLGKLPVGRRVAYLYDFLMRRFARLGIERAPHMTPLEFALASGNEIAGFTRNPSQTDFLTITLLYQRVAYGAGNVSEEEYGKVADYYRSFFGNARLRMSRPRWLFWGFWRI